MFNNVLAVISIVILLFLYKKFENNGCFVI